MLLWVVKLYSTGVIKGKVVNVLPKSSDTPGADEQQASKLQFGEDSSQSVRYLLAWVPQNP